MIKGRKPKATIIKVAQGTFRAGRHAGDEPVPQGPVERPAGLRGRAGELWDAYIARAFWLTWADGAKALMWCHLQAEFEQSPGDMRASRLRNLRAVASELGLDPSSRARLGAAL